jgi:hypothetical protein
MEPMPDRFGCPGVTARRPAGEGSPDPDPLVFISPAPRDAADLAIENLAGNVWEWCSSPYTPAGKENRVLRGGSWVFYQVSRSAHRNGGSPSLRDDSIGFLMACSSPFWGTDY